MLLGTFGWFLGGAIQNLGLERSGVLWRALSSRRAASKVAG